MSDQASQLARAVEKNAKDFAPEEGSAVDYVTEMLWFKEKRRRVWLEFVHYTRETFSAPEIAMPEKDKLFEAVARVLTKPRSCLAVSRRISPQRLDTSVSER